MSSLHAPCIFQDYYCHALVYGQCVTIIILKNPGVAPRQRMVKRGKNAPTRPTTHPELELKSQQALHKRSPKKRTISRNVCIASSRVYLPGYESQPTEYESQPSENDHLADHPPNELDLQSGDLALRRSSILTPLFLKRAGAGE